MSTHKQTLTEDDFIGKTLLSIHRDAEIGWTVLTFDGGFELHIPTELDVGFVFVHGRTQ